MNKHILGALYKKEMTDILRDKKTILMMIVVPLILYPLIFIGSMWLTTTIMSSSTRDTFVIAFDHLHNEEELKAFFDENQSEHDYSFAYTKLFEDRKNLDEQLNDGIINAYIKEEKQEDSYKYYIVYNSSDGKSSTASGMIQKMLEDYKEKLQIDRIQDIGIDPEYVMKPLDYEYMDKATNEETIGNLFGYIIPFLLVTSILMGAMYPAIDVTAGEKERGTLETLLTLPVTNLELITSKFLATSSVAVGAAFLNVLSMGILGGYFYGSMAATGNKMEAFDISVYLPAIGMMLVLAVVLALFASAVCLCVCIFAKSFKEAQNYSTPFMLVFMFAAMASLLPNIKLENGIELIPVVNIVVLISELFQFKFVFTHILMVLLSNIAYCILAILLMTKMYNSEEILFGESAGGIRLLEKRSQMKAKQIPGNGDIILLFAILLIVILLAGSLIIAKYGIWGLIIEQLLILGVTFGYCYYIKADFQFLFRFHKPKFTAFIGAILCWVGVYVAMMLLGAVLSHFFPESSQSANDAMLDIWNNSSLWLVIVSSAALPAFCEEVAFRGFLFGTLSRKYKAIPMIILTGALFGLYHMNLVKFFVVGLLGCLLAYLVYKSDSIWVSMLVHFMNNLFAVIVSECKDDLVQVAPFLFEENLSGGSMVLIVVVGIVSLIGGILLTKLAAGDYRKKNLQN